MAKKQNEYLIVYAIFAYHRFKSIVVTGETKQQVEKDFYNLHSRNDYRIKGVHKISNVDFEPTEDPDEILTRMGYKRCLEA